MKFLSYLPHPLIIGVLALLMMYLAAVPMIAPLALIGGANSTATASASTANQTWYEECVRTGLRISELGERPNLRVLRR